MSLFGRAERREIAELVQAAAVQAGRIRELEQSVEAAGISRDGATRREADMAERIITLERELKELRNRRLPEDTRELRRQLHLSRSHAWALELRLSGLQVANMRLPSPVARRGEA